jgi:hypothetical protein
MSYAELHDFRRIDNRSAADSDEQIGAYGPSRLSSLDNALPRRVRGHACVLTRQKIAEGLTDFAQIRPGGHGFVRDQEYLRLAQPVHFGF